MGRDPITKPLVKAAKWGWERIEDAADWGWERIDPSGLIPKIPDIPSIPPVEAAPSGTDSAVKEAADSTKKLEKKLEKKRRGALSTILTGWQGDTSAAPVVRKILLGE